MKCRRFLAAALAVLSVGCAGLPAKQQPAKLSSAAPFDGLDAAGGGDWPAAEWWKRYQDPTIDQLMELGLASSPTLATAHARYDSARQSVRIAGAASGAQVDASAGIDRQRLSDNGLSPRTCWASPGTTSRTWDCRPAIPSIGGANSATQ